MAESMDLAGCGGRRLWGEHRPNGPPNTFKWKRVIIEGQETWRFTAIAELKFGDVG